MEIRPTLVRLLLVVPLLVAGLSLGAPRPAAAASSCTTDIFGGTIKESLVVTGAFGSNPSGAIVVVGNTVRGNLVLQGNTARQEIIVRGNVIEANLDCSGNAPEPIQGDSNTVGGVATGQCAGLVTP